MVPHRLLTILTLIILGLGLLLAFLPAPASAGPGGLDFYLLDPPETALGFDQEATVYFVVHNPTNGTRAVRVTVNEDLEWSAVLIEEAAVIAPGETFAFELTVSAPRGFGEPEARFEITFQIVDVDIGNVSYHVEILTFTLVSDSADKAGKILGFITNPLPAPFDGLWASIALSVVIWLLGVVFLLFIFDPIFRWLTRATETEVDDMALAIIRGPLLWIYLVTGLLMIIYSIGLPPDILFWATNVYQITLILLIIWVIYKLFNDVVVVLGNRWTSRTKGELDNVLMPVIELAGKVGIVVAGAIFTLNWMGIDITVFLAGAGIIGLVVAFAAQDTLSNLFSGVHLLLVRPFRNGDTIILDDNRICRVEKVGLQTTQLYSIFEAIQVVIPNRMLTNSINRTITMPDRRLLEKVAVGVAYGTDPEFVVETLLAVPKAHEHILQEKGYQPVARFINFGESSLDFEIYYWLDDVDHRLSTRHDIHVGIFRVLKEAGIEIPFPQRDLHIRSGDPGPVAAPREGPPPV